MGVLLKRKVSGCGKKPVKLGEQHQTDKLIQFQEVGRLFGYSFGLLRVR